MNKNYALYEERGDLLERKALSEINGTGWYLQAQLDEINEQIRIIENVTLQAQNYYFETLAPAWMIEAEAQAADWQDMQNQYSELRGG